MTAVTVTSPRELVHAVKAALFEKAWPHNETMVPTCDIQKGGAAGIKIVFRKVSAAISGLYDDEIEQAHRAISKLVEPFGATVDIASAVNKNNTLVFTLTPAQA